MHRQHLQVLQLRVCIKHLHFAKKNPIVVNYARRPADIMLLLPTWEFLNYVLKQGYKISGIIRSNLNANYQLLYLSLITRIILDHKISEDAILCYET